MINICGKCAKEFKTEAEYCDHACKSTGFTPKDADNLGPEFKKVAENALERGKIRKEKGKKTK